MIKNNKECTEDRFLDDVKDHKISIVKDDGVHRFIRFKRPNTNSYWFDINTWPGFLCISGDMGTYVFSRLNDMFEFFRADLEYAQSKGKKLGINSGYWAEKLHSIDRRHGYTKFDSAEFESRVKDHFETYMKPQIKRKYRGDLWREIKDNVLFYSYEEHRAYQAIYDFCFTSDDGEEFRFVDFFDAGSSEIYTFHYIWCLYAIVWGISQYDLAKQEIAA